SLFAEAQGTSQKVAQQDAHLAGLGCVGGRKRADGIQAVEEEVRIDLCFECAQFSCTCEDTCLHHARLGIPRGLHSQQHIVKSDRQEIQQHACCKQQRI